VFLVRQSGSHSDKPGGALSAIEVRNAITLLAMSLVYIVLVGVPHVISVYLFIVALLSSHDVMDVSPLRLWNRTLLTICAVAYASNFFVFVAILPPFRERVARAFARFRPQ
jgi:hypothetical protein